MKNNAIPNSPKQRYLTKTRFKLAMEYQKYQGSYGGVPFLVVLDADGKYLLTQHTAVLEEGDHHSPQKVLAFLKEWAPK